MALFPPHPHVEAPGRGLRVSRYLDPADGPPHTRVSIYGADGRVVCVVALDERATTDLARFLGTLEAGAAPTGARGVIDRLAPWRSR